MAPIIPVAGGVVAALFKKIVSKQVNAQNYAKIKDLINYISRNIDAKKVRLTKTQNKIFNQQKNELKRFEKTFEPVPVKPKAKVLDFPSGGVDKVPVTRQFRTITRSDQAIKSRLEGMNKIARDRLNRRRFEKAVKAEKEKMSKDPDYIQDIIDPEDFNLASGGRVPFTSGGDAEDYGELIDAYELGVDVMPGETLTDYINRIRKAEKRRKNKASGGIAGQLHLNQGGRVSFTKGGKVSSGLAHILGV